MSKTVLLDSGIDLSTLIGSGVLIGSYLPTHVLGVYVAPTPVEAQEDEEDEDEGKGDAGAAQELDVPWMLEHAKQIIRMLPGGVEIIGFVYNSSQDSLSSKQSKIKKLLTGIRGLEGSSEELVFLVSGSKKGVCLTGEELKNIDYKISDEKIEYQELDSSVILDVPIALSAEKSVKKMIYSHAVKGIEKFERSLSRSMVLFNSSLRRDDELICRPQFDKKKKRGKEELDETMEEEDNSFAVSILVKDELNLNEDVAVEDNDIRIKFAGKLKTRAYVPNGSSIKACKAAILKDIRRSIRGRVTMHCDSLIGSEAEEGENGEGPIVHEPPRRIFTRLPGTSVSISDYLYPGEGGEDSIESVKELFGFSPAEEDIEDDLELLVVPKDVRSQADKSMDEGRAAAPRKAAALAYVIGSLAVAAISVGLAWFKFSNAAEDGEE